jgi:hypothetical protein
MNGKSEEGCVRAVVLTGYRGDGGAPIEFTEGKTVAGGGSKGPRGIDRRRGKLLGMLE